VTRRKRKKRQLGPVFTDPRLQVVLELFVGLIFLKLPPY
jgi:hypothetical protein